MRPEFLSLPGNTIRRELPASLRAPRFGPPAQDTARVSGTPINFAGLLFFTLALRIAVHASLPQAAPAAAQTCAKLAGPPGAAFCASLNPSAAMVYAPGFAFVGALVMTVISALLVRALARALGLGLRGQLTASFAYALWLPGIAACCVAAPEVLLTPAVLTLAVLCVRAAGWLFPRAVPAQA